MLVNIVTRLEYVTEMLKKLKMDRKTRKLMKMIFELYSKPIWTECMLAKREQFFLSLT